MTYQLKREQQLYCSISTAWTFFSSPHNLSRITPKDMGFTVLGNITEQEIYQGMIINYTVSPFFGIPVKWQTIIKQVDPQKSFTDFQQRGPYKLWNHEHQFIPNEQGVLMKDTVNYQLPLGILGTLAHLLIVKKKLRQIFDYRYQILEKVFNQAILRL